ncbi:hypothetical protein [Bacillus sp. EB600]|nr:hypothetical protein [Bacillus sp. EB600]MCQ6280412.1 hypothetical protein [Bacillus sp. EB600]
MENKMRAASKDQLVNAKTKMATQSDQDKKLMDKYNIKDYSRAWEDDRL